MPDVKEVINGLEMSYKYSNVDENNTLVPQWIVLHAIALLQAQEPKVMTLEEYKALAEKPKEERDPVWEEWPGLESTWAIPNQAYGGYGTSWRCWTSRPTDEQRKKEPWNG